MNTSTATSTPSAISVLGVGAVAEQVRREVARRASQPGYQWWLTHVMSAAACSHPVRLRLTATWHGENGHREVERVTDGMPDGVLYAACKNRRAVVCPACAETYRQDTYQLVKAGLIGGKGVPDTVTEHPCFFLTLTAPAFGPVHTRVVGSNDTVRPCRARRHGAVCEHGRQVICLQRHSEDDPRLGEAICRDCYDYQHQAVWNFHAAELWRRTTITLNRKLRQAAKDRGVHVRLSYAKVAEYQRRGVVHFHALVRLDGYDPDNRDAILAPHPAVTPELLASYLEHAVTNTWFTTASHPKNRHGWTIRWGDQLDIRRVRLTGVDTDDRGHLTTTAVAAYLAKYATKATEQAGHVSRRLTAADATHYAQLDTHQARQLIACWQLGQRPFYRSTKQQRDEWAETWGKLQKWAHMLGFGGHFSTKSRRYSTTLTALRTVRKAYQRGEPPEHPGHVPADADLVGEESTVTLAWLFDGVGWLTLGDAALANTAAAKARERKQIAKEEIEDAIAA